MTKKLKISKFCFFITDELGESIRRLEGYILTGPEERDAYQLTVDLCNDIIARRRRMVEAETEAQSRMRHRVG